MVTNSDPYIAATSYARGRDALHKIYKEQHDSEFVATVKILDAAIKKDANSSVITIDCLKKHFDGFASAIGGENFSLKRLLNGFLISRIDVFHRRDGDEGAEIYDLPTNRVPKVISNLIAKLLIDPNAKKVAANGFRSATEAYDFLEVKRQKVKKQKEDAAAELQNPELSNVAKVANVQRKQQLEQKLTKLQNTIQRLQKIKVLYSPETAESDDSGNAVKSQKNDKANDGHQPKKAGHGKKHRRAEGRAQAIVPVPHSPPPRSSSPLRTMFKPLNDTALVHVTIPSSSVPSASAIRQGRDLVYDMYLDHHDQLVNILSELHTSLFTEQEQSNLSKEVIQKIFTNTAEEILKCLGSEKADKEFILSYLLSKIPTKDFAPNIIPKRINKWIERLSTDPGSAKERRADAAAGTMRIDLSQKLRFQTTEVAMYHLREMLENVRQAKTNKERITRLENRLRLFGEDPNIPFIKLKKDASSSAAAAKTNCDSPTGPIPTLHIKIHAPPKDTVRPPLPKRPSESVPGDPVEPILKADSTNKQYEKASSAQAAPSVNASSVKYKEAQAKEAAGSSVASTAPATAAIAGAIVCLPSKPGARPPKATSRPPASGPVETQLAAALPKTLTPTIAAKTAAARPGPVATVATSTATGAPAAPLAPIPEEAPTTPVTTETVTAASETAVNVVSADAPLSVEPAQVKAAPPSFTSKVIGFFKSIFRLICSPFVWVFSLFGRIFGSKSK